MKIDLLFIAVIFSIWTSLEDSYFHKKWRVLLLYCMLLLDINSVIISSNILLNFDTKSTLMCMPVDATAL